MTTTTEQGATIVMPAYNAARHILAVLHRLLFHTQGVVRRVIVVDDGSLDDTAGAVRTLATGAERVTLIQRPHNGGYGAAVKDGLAAARRSGASHVACVHADGQYAPEALPGLLHALSADDLDLLQGSRIASGTALSGGMPMYKYLANAALNLLENRVLGLHMSDYHSGYLVYGPRTLATIDFDRLSDSFDFDLELIAAARAGGLRVGEAPIPTRYADEISHLRPIPYGLRVLRTLWRYKRGYYARCRVVA